MNSLNKMFGKKIKKGFGLSVTNAIIKFGFKKSDLWDFDANVFFPNGICET